MSYKNITSALAIAAVMGFSGAAFAEPNDDPIATGVEFTGSVQMELIESNLSVHPEALDPSVFGVEAPAAETADFEKSAYHDDRV